MTSDEIKAARERCEVMDCCEADEYEWRCPNCESFVYLGDGSERPEHDLCWECSTSEVTRLRELLMLIHAESESDQSDMESLVTCVNLAAKALGMECDDSVNGGREE
jgi:hypothetical protein